LAIGSSFVWFRSADYQFRTRRFSTPVNLDATVPDDNVEQLLLHLRAIDSASLLKARLLHDEMIDSI